MDRTELKEKLIPFQAKCSEKGKPLADLCIEDAFPGDKSTSYIVKVKARVDNMYCSEALDFLFDTLFETVDEKTREKVFSIYVMDSSDELHCWSDTRDLRRIADELEKLKTVHSTIMTGWLCPRCRTIHGPFVNQCHCQPETISRTIL